MKNYLFSYGTLQPGLAPPEIAPTVRRLRRVGRGRVRGRLYDLGEYPGAVLETNGPVILGQVFELPDDPDILKRLDEYEEFNPAQPKESLFVRKKCLVTLQNGKKVSCWIYGYNRDPRPSANLINGDLEKSRTHKSR